MSLWNQIELETIASFFPVIDWQESSRILGGIPRHVLEVTSDNPTDYYKQRADNVNSMTVSR
jgi:hypothetical protein